MPTERATLCIAPIAGSVKENPRSEYNHKICDKCGRVVDFPDDLKTINVCYIRDTAEDRQLQLCSVCKQEFVKTVEDFIKANAELGAQSSAGLVKHILEKDGNEGEFKNEK